MKILPEKTGPSDERSDAATVRISPMRRRHIRSILKIEEVVYPRPWAASVFASEIEQVPRARRYFVAHIGRRLVGYGGLLVAPDSAHITNVAVDPGYRRQGIATRVLLALARDAVDRGAPALTLEVRVGNDGAQQLYRRFGFVPAGMRKRYYEGTDDAIVMWAHDIGEPAYRARLDEIERSIEGLTEWELT
jgi:[ribosomal protein S18]-alanine N-acetyltransferase